MINRLLGRKRAKSANTPGITRSLQWIRVRGENDSTDVFGRTTKTKSKVHRGIRAGDFELLDSPGIIPANMENQEDAILLAVCNNIGVGAYDNQGVAAYLCERLKTLYVMEVQNVTAPQWREKSIERYNFDPLQPIIVPTLDDEKETRLPTGEDMLYQVAENTCRGDLENAARKILQDFRTGRMGPICLQLAPKFEEEEGVTKGTGGNTGIESSENFDGERYVPVQREVTMLGENIDFEQSYNNVSLDREAERLARAETAIQAAKEKGLELPPLIENQLQDENNEDGNDNSRNNNDTKEGETEIGKGLFDGW